MHPAQSPFLAVQDLAAPLQDEADDYDELMEMAEGKSFVLFGEATHGTQVDAIFHLDETEALEPLRKVE